MKRLGTKLFCFGLGYVAEALAGEAGGAFDTVVGTTRDPKRAAADGRVLFDESGPISGAEDVLAGTSHLLLSIPPGETGDPALAAHRDLLAGLETLQWIGYLSTTGVYGDRQGEWVGEDDPPRPGNQRSKKRLAAEEAWLDFGAANDVPVQVFRLAGIYGPGRSALDQVRAGGARRIVKPGQVFSRVHVDDIVQVLIAAMKQPSAAPVFNVCDDEPAPQADVIAFAAELLGVPAPPAEPFETAELSAMARSFYAECRRVRNDRIKAALGVALRYPSYREGLEALAS